jgi:nitrite reductase/ring-hydroxylating ferredoxin subunit
MPKTQVGLVKDVPQGTVKGFKVGDTRILIANLGGTFSAIGDRCTHRGCTLSKGRLEGEVVTCPCHGSRFNVKTGAVVRGPAEEPEPSLPVTIEGDGIWVDM